MPLLKVLKPENHDWVILYVHDIIDITNIILMNKDNFIAKSILREKISAIRFAMCHLRNICCISSLNLLLCTRDRTDLLWASNGYRVHSN